MNIKRYLNELAIFDDKTHGYRSIEEILASDYYLYSWSEIFNRIGINILGKDNARLFKSCWESLYNTGNTAYNYEINDSEEIFHNLMIEIYNKLNEYTDVINVINGLLIAKPLSWILFEPDNEDFMSWKYSNWNENRDENTPLKFSEEYTNLFIND